jgi:hypothetical protein
LRRDVFDAAGATTGFSSFMGFLLGGFFRGVSERFWAGGWGPSSLGGNPIPRQGQRQ